MGESCWRVDIIYGDVDIRVVLENLGVGLLILGRVCGCAGSCSW